MICLIFYNPLFTTDNGKTLPLRKYFEVNNIYKYEHLLRKKENKWEKMVEIFEEIQIDNVTSGLKSVADSIVEPLNYWNNNVLGTISLLEVMEEFNCKNIVFSSSATVYGLDNKSPIKENGKLSPNNPYGNTKLAIEKLFGNLTSCLVKMIILQMSGFHQH